MKKNLLYSTMKWEMQRKDIKKNIDKNSSYITQGLHFILGNLNNDKSDIIYEYNSLAFEYYNIANKSYFATEDLEAFKGYYYLSAKAIDMCFILYEKNVSNFITVMERFFSYIPFIRMRGLLSILRLS